MNKGDKGDKGDLHAELAKDKDCSGLEQRRDTVIGNHVPDKVSCNLNIKKRDISKGNFFRGEDNIEQEN